MLPDLETIGNQAFAEVGTVTFSGDNRSLKTIGIDAFGGATAVVGLHTLPALVTIWDGAFKEATNTVEFGIKNTKLTTIGKSAFAEATAVKGLETLPALVTIGDGAFPKVREVKFSGMNKSLTTIGDGAFAEATVEGLPDMVTKGNRAFS